MGKRGLSPLIATVVLIAFAVSLGAVVMNLGSNLANDGSLTESKECVGLKLKFHDLKGPQVTFGGQGSQGFIEFVADNVGMEIAPTIRLTIIGDKQGAKQAFVFDIDNANLQPGVPLSKRIALNFDSYGKPEQIKIFPIALVDGKKIPCLSSGDEYLVP